MNYLQEAKQMKQNILNRDNKNIQQDTDIENKRIDLLHELLEPLRELNTNNVKLTDGIFKKKIPYLCGRVPKYGEIMKTYFKLGTVRIESCYNHPDRPGKYYFRFITNNKKLFKNNIGYVDVTNYGCEAAPGQGSTTYAFTTSDLLEARQFLFKNIAYITNIEGIE